MKIVTTALSFAFLTPMLVLAQGELGGVTSFVQNIIDFMNGTLVPFVFAIAFLVFLWGLFQFFILGASDEGKRETGRTYMMYGIIGFVIMVSVWGIVNLLASGFGFSGQDLQEIPNLPGTN